MVTAEKAVEIVKSVAVSLGYPEMVVEHRTNTVHKSCMKIIPKDRKKMVSLFKKKNGVRDVMTVFPQYTKMQIAAIKAWVTMGKY